MEFLHIRNLLQLRISAVEAIVAPTELWLSRRPGGGVTTIYAGTGCAIF